MKHMQKQDGFTLLELIIVIVILGILSVIAIPKFVDLQDSALSSSMQAVLGAVRSASQLAYVNGKLQGVENGNITIGNTTMPLVQGYMEGRGSSSFLIAVEISDITTGLTINDVCPSAYCTHGNEVSMPDVPGSSGGKGVYLWPEGYAVTDDCFIYYYNKEDGSEPLIGIIDSGC